MTQIIDNNKSMVFQNVVSVFDSMCDQIPCNHPVTSDASILRSVPRALIEETIKENDWRKILRYERESPRSLAVG